MSATAEHHLPPHILQALAPFVRGKRRPVSIALMVKAARYAVPNLPYTDEVLADLLRKELIGAGCMIDLDSREGLRELPARH